MLLARFAFRADLILRTSSVSLAGRDEREAPWLSFSEPDAVLLSLLSALRSARLVEGLRDVEARSEDWKDLSSRSGEGSASEELRFMEIVGGTGDPSDGLKLFFFERKPDLNRDEPTLGMGFSSAEMCGGD